MPGTDRRHAGRRLFASAIAVLVIGASVAAATTYGADYEFPKPVPKAKCGPGAKPETDIQGRDVLVVEDVIDSGLTLSWLVGNLKSRGPRSVEICTMIRKPLAFEVDLEVRYVGFDLPNEFIVGYGLDYAEKYRNLPFIGTLAPHVYEK